jgi:hypothetical protein
MRPKIQQLLIQRSGKLCIGFSLKKKLDQMRPKIQQLLIQRSGKLCIGFSFKTKLD